MKTKNVQILVTAIALAGASALNATQPFNAGSTGAYGAMNITTNTTLDMPADGIFHATSINVASGATLTFRRNALNTPVYLLAQSNVVISGTIDVSGTPANGGAPGLGGPGGFDGGYGGFTLAAPGDGKGPGAGHGGSFGDVLVNANFAYGNTLCVPLVGGSGGGGQTSGSGGSGFGGGGGGGAILIASSTSISVNGTIVSRGAGGGTGVLCYGFGSGGAIRIVAPLVSGSGAINASQGCSIVWGGRIRIDCLDRFAFRTLHLQAGVTSTTRGSQMFVFPPTNPRLDIVQAAGRSIPAGTTNSVSFDLPPGPSTNITVRVQATDFTNNIPIRVVVTPENGASSSVDATIDIGQGNPASTNVTVTLPAGFVSTIHAWTR